jgi:hypothetical protein
MSRRGAWLLLLAATAAAEPEWMFRFQNGDRVSARLAAVRDGTALLEVRAASRAVAVPIEAIRDARPVSPPEHAGAAHVLKLMDGGALLGRCRAIREGRMVFEVESIGSVTVAGRDIAELLPAEEAVRAYWRVVAADAAAAQALPPERFEALWTYLGHRDPNRAWEAHRELVRAGEGAVARLEVPLRTQPDAPTVVAMWIDALDARSAEVREIAQARLHALGEVATPHLRARAKGELSAEARRRVAALLETPAEAPPPDAEITRFLRAIRVLEEIATPGAREILDRLARGAPGGPTATAAGEALERLRRLN